MLRLLQRVLKTGGLLFLGFIVGVGATTFSQPAPQNAAVQVIVSPVPDAREVQGAATEVIESASPAASIEPIKSATPSPTPKASPTKKPTPSAKPKATKSPTPKPTVKPTSLPVSQTTPSQPQFSCNCSKTCTQISSCEEAQYLLNSCGCGARDADKDGIACDSAPLNCQN